MIRREMHDQDWLITQHDHARLAGQFARHLGNAAFARPAEFDSFVTAVSLHDAGWPLHDDAPTIDPAGRPLHVFDRPWNVALQVWGESVERAVAADPYAGLLVSIHTMRITQDLADRETPAAKFAILKFFHREIERQEQLRRQLGFRTDLPLQFGLALAAGVSPREDQLAYAFRWLQACDLLSLAALTTTPVPLRTREVQHAPAGKPFMLRLHRPAPAVLSVDPWPFELPRLRSTVPVRRLPRRTYADDLTFRAAYAAAQPDTLDVELHAI